MENEIYHSSYILFSIFSLGLHFLIRLGFVFFFNPSFFPGGTLVLPDVSTSISFFILICFVYVTALRRSFWKFCYFIDNRGVCEVGLLISKTVNPWHRGVHNTFIILKSYFLAFAMESYVWRTGSYSLLAYISRPSVHISTCVLTKVSSTTDELDALNTSAHMQLTHLVSAYQW